MRSICISASLALSAGEMYCPSQNDFQMEGTNLKWNGAGWTMTGGGGVHGKQTFNLLGGYIEFDMDTTGAHTGVNNNFYFVSPDPSYFKASNDCDIQGQFKPSCMEMDIVENNGNCLAQTTWHTWPNHNGGCDRGGCMGQKYRSGKTKMRAEFTKDGWMTVFMDGSKVDVTHPVPSEAAHKVVHDTMASKGVQIQSSQWVGWVPSGNCGGGGGLGSSTFSIHNIVVSGTVVQGPQPQKCRPGPAPAPTPPAPPAPSPPTPSSGCCSWDNMHCGSTTDYCKASQDHCENHCKGKWIHPAVVV